VSGGGAAGAFLCTGAFALEERVAGRLGGASRSGFPQG